MVSQMPNRVQTKRRQQTAFATRMEILDRGRKLAADRAADAARLQHHHRLVDALEQVMIIMLRYACGFSHRNGNAGEHSA
jgi:hypothetical protein